MITAKGRDNCYLEHYHGTSGNGFTLDTLKSDLRKSAHVAGNYITLPKIPKITKPQVSCHWLTAIWIR